MHLLFWNSCIFSDCVSTQFNFPFRGCQCCTQNPVEIKTSVLKVGLKTAYAVETAAVETGVQFGRSYEGHVHSFRRVCAREHFEVKKHLQVSIFGKLQCVVVTHR